MFYCGEDVWVSEYSKNYSKNKKRFKVIIETTCSLPTPFNGTPNGGSTSTGLENNELIQDILDGRNGSTQPNSKKAKHASVLHEFMVMLSVCHTVIPEKIDDNIIYHAASPGKSIDLCV